MQQNTSSSIQAAVVKQQYTSSKYMQQYASGSIQAAVYKQTVVVYRQQCTSKSIQTVTHKEQKNKQKHISSSVQAAVYKQQYASLAYTSSRIQPADNNVQVATYSINKPQPELTAAAQRKNTTYRNKQWHSRTYRRSLQKRKDDTSYRQQHTIAATSKAYSSCNIQQQHTAAAGSVQY